MENGLLDTSWTLHHVFESTDSYSAFLRAQNHDLDQWSARLQQHLETSTPQYRDDFKDENQRTGPFRGCQFSRSSLNGYSQSNSTSRTTTDRRALLVRLKYHHITFKFVLCELPLDASNNDTTLPHSATVSDQRHGSGEKRHVVLAKASQTHFRRFITFLEDNFTVSVQHYKLSSTTILQSLQNYLTSISTIWSAQEDRLGDDAETTGTDALQLATLNSILGILRMTITISTTASSAVAPNLKAIDLDIPSDTIAFLSRQRSSPSSPSSPKRTGKSTSKSTGPRLFNSVDHNGQSHGTSFLDELSRHIHERSGLRLPLSPSTTRDMDASTVGNRTTDTGPSDDVMEVDPASAATSSDQPRKLQRDERTNPLFVSKISCAAFALSIDGRVKFASRPLGGIDSNDDDGGGGGTEETDFARTVRQANAQMLLSVLSDHDLGSSSD